MMHNRELQKAVLEELGGEPSIAAGDIGVSADDGIVTLSGHVTSFAEKHAAGRAARHVKGVKAVVEHIEVKLPFDSARDDSAIAAAGINRLLWDVSVPKNKVKLSVERGWVELTGEVEWYYQKAAAEEDVRRLLGVTGITNHVTIRPRVNTEVISDGIMHAMNRSWFFDTNTVHVTADAGRVRLTGTVPTGHERRLAAFTAWGSPGVTDVENDLTIAG